MSVRLHADDCPPFQTCVECGGCECGAIPSACTGPGCWSQEAEDQWRDENGYNEVGSW